MYEIHVRIDIQSPIGDVFDAVSDHERFFRGHGVTRSQVTRPGRDEKNGLGAIREIDAGGHHFVEEVVRFERPRRFDYIVRSVTRGGMRLPMQHELGWLELSEQGRGTHLEWRSRFRITIPLLGGVLERVMGPRMAQAFQRLLEQARGELERARPAA